MGGGRGGGGRRKEKKKKMKEDQKIENEEHSLKKNGKRDRACMAMVNYSFTSRPGLAATCVTFVMTSCRAVSAVHVHRIMKSLLVPAASPIASCVRVLLC